LIKLSRKEDLMNVVAINGSARKEGNTTILVQKVFDEMGREGIDTEQVHLAGKKIKGCIACFRCFENLDRKCAVDNDFINECIGKMDEADGIILASPTYFASVSTELKAVMDRAGLVAIANGNMLARKVGAAVVSVRRGGAVTARSPSSTPSTTSFLSRRWSSPVPPTGISPSVYTPGRSRATMRA
jgi:multimeric flavodoxin WrbA